MAAKKEKREDLRIRRTHKLLCDAMFQLLETRSFDDISVVDICDRAMVHRATFYKHFKDKYDFMEYVTKEKIREFYIESVQQEEFSSPIDIYHTLIKNVIHFIEDNKQMLKISAQSSTNSFFDSIHKIIFEELLDFLNASQEKGVKFDVPTDIVAQFLTGGFTALVRWWIANDISYTKEEMASYIEMMLTASSAEARNCKKTESESRNQ